MAPRRDITKVGGSKVAGGAEEEVRRPGVGISRSAFDHGGEGCLDDGIRFEAAGEVDQRSPVLAAVVVVDRLIPDPLEGREEERGVAYLVDVEDLDGSEGNFLDDTKRLTPYDGGHGRAMSGVVGKVLAEDKVDSLDEAATKLGRVRVDAGVDNIDVDALPGVPGRDGVVAGSCRSRDGLVAGNVEGGEAPGDLGVALLLRRGALGPGVGAGVKVTADILSDEGDAGVTTRELKDLLGPDRVTTDEAIPDGYTFGNPIVVGVGSGIGRRGVRLKTGVVCVWWGS
jgi:hypothetical protein